MNFEPTYFNERTKHDLMKLEEKIPEDCKQALAENAALRAENERLRRELDEARVVFTLMKFMSDQIALIRHDWLEKEFSTAFVITHKKLVHKLESVKKK